MFIEIGLAMFEGSAWSNMFVLDAEKVLWAEKIIRPILVYFTLILLLRVFGNREMAQLNPVDFVLLLLISETVQNAIIGDDTSLSGGIVGVTVLLGVSFLTSYVKFRSKRIETLLEGEPRTLIENGEIKKDAIKREMLTEEDLDVVAREEGLDSAKEIEKLVLNPNGTFLVDGRDEIKDREFKREILEKINKLTEQLNDLQKTLKNHKL
ncbi:MAG: DUF421 domain-containing protein [Pyrinomonadaceae bacterium]|nr:DUF421 domain-containing protein [Pyrinomonadaceae bacterium]